MNDFTVKQQEGAARGFRWGGPLPPSIIADAPAGSTTPLSPGITTAMGFKSAGEPALSSCSVGEAQFCRILLKVAEQYISTWCVRDPPLNMTELVKSLIQKRDEARQHDRNNHIIRTLYLQIAEKISENNRKNWRRG